jgi:transitional endoplasmic reticulum ATPase
VWIDADRLPVEGRSLVRALAGRPISAGDVVEIDATVGGAPTTVRVDRVEPNPAGIVGPGTRFVSRAEQDVEPSIAAGAPEVRRTAPTASQALLAGLDAELDLLTGWFTLLTAPDDLPAAWGLPRVAGVLVDGPPGCGASELVHAAAAAAGADVHEVDVDLVFKPERLLDLLSAALERPAPLVIFVDRLEAVAGEEGLTPFRSQIGAILRWFLDAVAERPGTACVLAVGSRGHLDPAISRSPLLPRSLTIPPPDLTRRRLLFEAALARVPSREIDHDLLAARSAGFAGSDVVSAVMHASAMAARTGNGLTTADLLAAIQATTPSLGTVPMGEMPSYGFEEVANLVDVKQRLTESVIWPVTDPGRFRSMGIDPPRGILLYGPPGTGKTFVIRALAHEAGAAFFAVKGAELLDKYVGESERGVRELFARARAAEPSILFFDELDALAPVRGRSTTSVTDSVVAALLTEIDGVAARGSVAVIGATNRRDLIDPALLRAGRFEIQIELGLPERDARLALLRLSDVPFAADVDIERLADLTEGRSFADLAGLLREAALVSLRADVAAREVRWEHVESALATRSS